MDLKLTIVETDQVLNFSKCPPCVPFLANIEFSQSHMKQLTISIAGRGPCSLLSLVSPFVDTEATADDYDKSYDQKQRDKDHTEDDEEKVVGCGGRR